MTDLEQRLADRLQARAEAYAVRSDLDAVVAGVAQVRVLEAGERGRRRTLLGITLAGMAAVASVIVVLALTTRSDGRSAIAPAADARALFEEFVGDAEPVEAQQIPGATLYTAPGIDGDQTCLLIELDESSSASCADAEAIRSGTVWTKSGFHEGDPELITGLVASDVTAVEINGATVPVVNNTWALFTTDAVSAYILIRGDGATQTVSIQPAAPTLDGT